MPPLDELQRDPSTKPAWIGYSARDAECTWQLRATLERRLRELHWTGDRSLYELYNMYLVPFGECLTDMERAGIRVDKDMLHRAEVLATQHRAEAESVFL